MKTLAFIGTREPEKLSEEWVALYRQLAAVAGRFGHRVVTGAAPGCDQLAAEAALAAGGLVLLMLPWENYEFAWWSGITHRYPDQVERVIYDPEGCPEQWTWVQSVREHHPVGSHLKRGAVALHARNYGIVAAAERVVALPSSRPGGGGTGQGMRVARALGKRLYDLTQGADREALQRGLVGR